MRKCMSRSIQYLACLVMALAFASSVAGAESESTAKPFEWEGFRNDKEAIAALRREFPPGTVWPLVHRRLVASGARCEPLEPYQKLNLPDGVRMSTEAKRIEEASRFRVLCSAAIGSRFSPQAHAGVWIQIVFDEQKQLVTIGAYGYPPTMP